MDPEAPTPLNPDSRLLQKIRTKVSVYKQRLAPHKILIIGSLVAVLVILVGTILFVSLWEEVPGTFHQAPSPVPFSEGQQLFQPNPPSRQSAIDSEQKPVAQVLSFFWEKDSGSRITDGSVPYIYKMPDGKSRLYYCNSQGILSAISSDGLTFNKEQGVRIAPGQTSELIVCDPTIVDLPDGRIRMYYKGASSMNPGPGQSIHKIFSAVSSDGLTFQKEGLRIDSETNGDNGWASVPDAIVLPDGRVRLYYVTAAAMQHGIGSAISSDGLKFDKEPGIRVPDLVDPALVKMGDRYVLFAASIDERFAKVPRGIYYLESLDGLNFSKPMAVFQSSDVYDPSVLKIDEDTIRVFYGKIVPPQLPAVESHTGRIAE